MWMNLSFQFIFFLFSIIWEVIHVMIFTWWNYKPLLFPLQSIQKFPSTLMSASMCNESALCKVVNNRNDGHTGENLWLSEIYIHVRSCQQRTEMVKKKYAEQSPKPPIVPLFPSPFEFHSVKISPFILTSRLRTLSRTSTMVFWLGDGICMTSAIGVLQFAGECITWSSRTRVDIVVICRFCLDMIFRELPPHNYLSARRIVTGGKWWCW